MKCYYDFHIHTALSPCGDDDMTPNNIVNMAMIKGLDAIAITDHNTAKNVPACLKCAENTGITLIPGMEIETAEEVHLVALFDNLPALMELDRIIEKNMPEIKNRVDIFGEQNILDENDEITGTIENLLVTACELDVESATKVVRSLGGVVIPAHIDKDSYSIVSNLGFVPEYLNYSTIEVKDPNKINELSLNNKMDKFLIIHNSDAHFLWDMHEKEYFIDVDEISVVGILNKLKKGLL